MVLTFAVLIVFPAAMAVALAMDLITMTIPNRVSLALAAAFFALAPFVGLSLEQIGMHSGIALAMLAIGFFLFAMDWIGGGDAKLFAATSLWMGPAHVLEYAVAAALLGGILTLGILLLRATPLPAGLVRLEWVARLHDSRSGVPYGIALALAGLWIYPGTVWMHALAH